MAAGTTELFKLLLDNKLTRLQRRLTPANVNARDSAGQSLLHNAVRDENVDAVRLLLDHGANADALDNNGDTPLIYAACRDGGDIGRIHEIATLLLQAGANPNHKGYQGFTALRWAVGNPSGDFRIVHLLLKHGADPRIKDDGGADAVLVAETIFPDLARELKRAKPGTRTLRVTRGTPGVVRRRGAQR